MLIRAKVYGDWVYMDPTQSHQRGGIHSAVQPDYGLVLPISGRVGQGLERITITDRDRRSVDVRETYLFAPFGMMLTVHTEFRGRSADIKRYDWASSAKSGLASHYLDYYAKVYPGLTRVGNLRMHDDPIGNIVTIDETYFLPQSALTEPDLYSDFAFRSEDYARYFIDPVESRTFPMWLGSARDEHWRIEVRNAPIWFTPPEPLRIENEAFSYAFTGEADENGNMTLDWSYRTKTRLVHPSRVPAILKDAEQIGDNYSWYWDLTPFEGEDETEVAN
jgi:hypothetical protein